MPSSALLLELLFTAFATFVGAWAAFQLQRSHDQAKEKRARLDAGRRAQFALAAQSNVLYPLKVIHLDPVRKHSERHVLLKPLANFQKIPDIDLSSIDFLFESTDADLLNRLLDCNNKFTTVIGNLDQRFAVYVRFQQALAQAERDGFPAKAKIVDMEKAVGGEIAGALRSVADLLYDSVDEAVLANERCFAELRSRLRSLFPKAKVLDREALPPYGPKGNAA